MRKLVLMFLAVLAAGALPAQNRQVSGTVTNADGEPVSGATIVVAGTSIGTITDALGQFTLNAPADGMLNISYMGMVPQSTPISNRAVIDVTLQFDAVTMEHVVVIGLGVTRSEKSTGYSTQKLDPGILNQTSNTDLAGALQGKMSGVNITPSSGMPGASSLIVIRGARSFTGNNSPLYVVDGMPVNSGIDVSTYDPTTGNGGAGGSDYANRSIDIDPNDIESINVLKGQAASALYGMRASNGVVMITTKSGRGGEKGRTNVTFNTSVTLDRISRLPDFQTTYAQGSFNYDTGNVEFSPMASTSWGPKISELANDPVWGYGGTGPSSTSSDKVYWDKWKTFASEGEYFVPQRAYAGLDPWVTPAVYKNNVRDFFNIGVTTNNSVNVSKATGDSFISATFSNAYQTGIIPSTGMERYNAKLMAETKLGRNRVWTLGFSGNYVNTRIDKATSANDGIVATIYPTPPNFDLAGIPYHYKDEPFRQNTYRATSGFDAAYWYVNNNVFRENTSRFFGNAYLGFKPVLGSSDHNLDLRLQAGTDTYATKYHEIWGYGHKNGSGAATERLHDVTNFNGLLTANYNWNINEKLRLDVSAGSEFIQENTKKTYVNGQFFNFPDWNHMSNATSYTSTETRRRFRSVGFFGTATLGFDNQLYLTITGRDDIISSMPRNNRSFFYPSASLSWIFTELDAIDNSVLSYGKLRVAVAQVGQAGDYYEPYYEIPIYGSGFYDYPPFVWPYGGMTAFAPAATLYDPNLRPQNTNSIEAGFDLSFFNGILGLNYTYSYQNITDQIFAIPTAASTGVSEVVQNGGQIVTNAHEITLSVTPRLGKDFRWSTDFNFSTMDNRVKSLATGVESIYLGGFVTPQIRGSAGDKFPSIYGVSFLRDEAGNKVLDGYGYPIAGEPKVIGSAQPKFILGANTTFSYKNISLAAVFEWKHGGQMLGATAGIIDYYGVSEKSRIAREKGIRYSGVAEDGTPMDVELTSPGDVQDYFGVLDGIDESYVFDSSFVKLREISLSYNFKAGKYLNMGVNVFARNLLLWTGYPNFDPESSLGNDNMAGAFERFTLPQTSSFGMGLSFKF